MQQLPPVSEPQNVLQPREILAFFDNIQRTNIGAEICELLPLDFPPDNKLKLQDMCFFKIHKLAYDKDYPHREAFENVLLSLDNVAFNFVYILAGTTNGIDLYIGVVRNSNQYAGTLSAADYGTALKNAFEGNFNGSVLEKVRGKDLQQLVQTDRAEQPDISAGVITGIPSINEFERSKEVDFQGIDRLINSMLGLEWRLIVINEPVPKQEIIAVQSTVYDLYNRLALIAKRTVQHSESSGTATNSSKNESDTRSKNSGWSKSEGESKGSASSSANWNQGKSGGSAESHSKGSSTGKSENQGQSDAVTVEMANKHACEIMKYIDEEFLDRLKLGFSKGLFKSSIYYTATNPADAHRLKVGIMSLFQGNKSSFSPLCAQELAVEPVIKRTVLTTFQNRSIENTQVDTDVLMLKSIPAAKETAGLHTFLTAQEISLIAGLPQNEVPGITLIEGVGFGLNEKKRNESKSDSSITLGTIVQKGRELAIPFTVSKKSMMKHTFIAGVTGSGKTTTCHNLLHEADTPFLVLEPAKTEYRTLITSALFKDKPVTVFTLGNETIAPFRLNPFELIKGENVSSHIDMVKAAFTSAFPMEASMPQLLEEALYSCYKKRGWDADTNTNTIYGDYAYDAGINSFPIMSDLLEEMKEVVQTKHFGTELQNNYIGSLVSRLSNLTVGSKGAMLNCRHSTDFDYIATHNVVLEMESLKSPEDKALFMGFILARLSAVIREKHKQDSSFKHITLVEEAHRLLAKVEFSDSGAKKAAVETFTDLLAEVRKYGEGLIIVDQIPNKLASEVLKNTNTKIIHKILAKDDKEAVGDTMLMNDKQKEYLSALEVGYAIVFTEDTDKPVHVKINKVSNTDEDELPDEAVTNRFEEVKELAGFCYTVDKMLAPYKTFSVLCAELAAMHDNPALKQALNTELDKTAAVLKMSRESILQQLIERHDRLTGKFMANAEHYDTERKETVYRRLSDYLQSKEPPDTASQSFQKLVLLFI